MKDVLAKDQETPNGISKSSDPHVPHWILDERTSKNTRTLARVGNKNKKSWKKAKVNHIVIAANSYNHQQGNSAQQNLHYCLLQTYATVLRTSFKSSSV